MSNDNGAFMLCFRPDPRLVARIEAWKQKHSDRVQLPIRSITNQLALHHLLNLALDAEGVEVANGD